MHAAFPRVALTLCALLLLAGCVPVPDQGRSRAFASPLALPATRAGTVLYFPYVVAPEQPVKLGIGSPYGRCDLAQQLGAAFYYDWGPTPAYCAEVRALAMVWGAFTTPPAVPWYVDTVLGFNEPDLQQQSNLSPQRAADLWRKLQAAYPTKRLIAPAPSPWGREWLARFRAACPDCRLDGGLAAHCYWQTADQCIRELKWYLDRAAEWGLPGVWVTEWAILPCPVTSLGVAGRAPLSAAMQEAEKLRAWLDAAPGILGYAWFADYIRGDEWWAFQPAACDTSLFDSSGYLTAWGLWYAR